VACFVAPTLVGGDDSDRGGRGLHGHWHVARAESGRHVLDVAAAAAAGSGNFCAELALQLTRLGPDWPPAAGDVRGLRFGGLQRQRRLDCSKRHRVRLFALRPPSHGHRARHGAVRPVVRRSGDAQRSAPVARSAGLRIDHAARLGSNHLRCALGVGDSRARGGLRGATDRSQPEQNESRVARPSRRAAPAGRSRARAEARSRSRFADAEDGARGAFGRRHGSRFQQCARRRWQLGRAFAHGAAGDARARRGSRSRRKRGAAGAPSKARCSRGGP
jgi:hypothetical protein